MIDKFKYLKRIMLIASLIEAIVIIGYIIFTGASSIIGDFNHYKIVTAIVFGIAFVVSAILLVIGLHKVEKEARKNHIDIANTLGADITEAFLYGELGLIVYDAAQTIIWTSDLFEDRNIVCVGRTIEEFIPEASAFFKKGTTVPEEVKCVINNRTYSIINKNELNLLVLKDVTEVDDLYQTKQEQQLVYMTITMDNLLDLRKSSQSKQTEEMVEIELEVRKQIAEWAQSYNAFITNVKEDLYVMIASEEQYAKIAKDKFSVMAKVEEITKSTTLPLTISIGIGRGSADFNIIASLSSSAIDVALSRGGGQIVINNYGAHMEFVGGTTEIRTKRNAVRSKVLSQSLSTHIENNNKILIVPHNVADFDAIGSSLALFSLSVSKAKEAYVVCSLDQMELKTRAAVKQIFDATNVKQIFISENQAKALIDDNTLVIMTDVSRPTITTCPSLIEVSKNVAVIDHHRRGEDAVDNPIFSLVETSASSASEIVVSLIKYAKDKHEFGDKIATMLFAGLLLDTNGFKVNASAETFETAMLLKEQGADTSTANDFLKDEFEEYELKNKIISNSETVTFGTIIASAPEEMIVDRTILAKVGQDALQVKGIKAIFVVGKIGQDTIGVSARSDGTFNVQFIMEKMGGGGHFAMAATQINDKSVEQVKDEIKKLVETYSDEIKQ